MTQLSKWLSLEQAVKSDTAIKKGIKNEPNPAQKRALVNLAQKVYDPLCEAFGGRVPATSVFRSPALNRTIGGSVSTQHAKGEAIDLDGQGVGISNKDIFDWIKEKIEFDQLIWEFGNDAEPDWVHVSIKPDGNNRGQVLRAVREGNRVSYINR